MQPVNISCPRWILSKKDLGLSEVDARNSYDVFVSETARSDVSYSSYLRRVREVYHQGIRVQEKSFNPPVPQEKLNSANFAVNGDQATIDVTVNRIKSLEDLLVECKVDLTIWTVENYTCNKWEMASSKNGESVIVPLFQVKAFLKKKNPEAPVVHPIVLPYKKRRVLVECETKPAIKKTLLIADAQVGYTKDFHTGKMNSFHDEVALDVVLSVVKDNQFDEIIVNGDMLDLPMASTFTQNPESTFTLQESVNYLAQYLLDLREAAPKAKIVYLKGNHCLRLEKRLVENMAYVYKLKNFRDSVPFYSLRRLLDLDSMDIEFIEEYPKGEYWVHKELKVKHGEFASLEKELSFTTVSTIIGHLHTPKILTKIIHTPEGMKTVTVGCCPSLCKSDGSVPGAVSRPGWSPGFMTIYSDMTNNTSNFAYHLIENGRCIFNDQVYQPRESEA